MYLKENTRYSITVGTGKKCGNADKIGICTQLAWLKIKKVELLKKAIYDNLVSQKKIIIFNLLSVVVDNHRHQLFRRKKVNYV